MSNEEEYCLSKEEKQLFEKQGFLVIPNFVSEKDVNTMINTANRIVDGYNPESMSVFSTKNQKSNTDMYFLESANNVSMFFEERAFDEQGNLQKPKHMAINKIGHALHDIVPCFREWSRSSKVKSLLKSLDYSAPIPVQSMYIFKQPHVGGEVVPHQDGTFLATEPQSVVGLWIALEDATKENGCLWGLAGSHKDGVHRRFVRQGNAVSFEGSLPDVSLGAFTPLEVTKGSLVILHGSNIHCSKENTSDKSRHAFSVHFVEGGPGHRYLENNWLQRRPDFPFVPLY